MPSSQRDAGQTISAIRALLDRTRADLLGSLLDDVDTNLSPTDYDRFLVGQRLEQIDATMARLEFDVRTLADDELAAAAERGVADVVDRLSALDTPSSTPIGVDVPTLQLVQDIAGAQVRVALEEIKGKVNLAVQRAMAGGLDLRGLQREIRDAFAGNVTEDRIDKIIRTETVQAYSQAQAAADEKLAGTPVADELIKRWNAVGGAGGDGRNRVDHMAIHGQERELDQLFNIGGGATAATPPGAAVGEKANGPADPSLSARQAIRCRCFITYHPRSRAKQDYIEKDPEKAAAVRRARLGAVA